MNVNALEAVNSLNSHCEGLSPQETIEVCYAVIDEAERIKEIAEAEINDEQEGDEETD